ncbi:hypothetical protein HDV05_007586 [Chytridiales sp. JEL 0842]|nr:hypothetical protein HDV05_007586 [Chytridiales sp. JEL 0842]
MPALIYIFAHAPSTWREDPERSRNSSANKKMAENASRQGQSSGGDGDDTSLPTYANTPSPAVENPPDADPTHEALIAHMWDDDPLTHRSKMTQFYARYPISLITCQFLDSDLQRVAQLRVNKKRLVDYRDYMVFTFSANLGYLIFSIVSNPQPGLFFRELFINMGIAMGFPFAEAVLLSVVLKRGPGALMDRVTRWIHLWHPFFYTFCFYFMLPGMAYSYYKVVAQSGLTFFDTFVDPLYTFVFYFAINVAANSNMLLTYFVAILYVTANVCSVQFASKVPAMSLMSGALTYLASCAVGCVSCRSTVLNYLRLYLLEEELDKYYSSDYATTINGNISSLIDNSCSQASISMIGGKDNVTIPSLSSICSTIEMGRRKRPSIAGLEDFEKITTTLTKGITLGKTKGRVVLRRELTRVAEEDPLQEGSSKLTLEQKNDPQQLPHQEEPNPQQNQAKNTPSTQPSQTQSKLINLISAIISAFTSPFLTPSFQFKNPHLESLFATWRLRHFETTYIFSSFTLALSAFLQAGMDVYTFCDPDLTLKSPSLCPGRPNFDTLLDTLPRFHALHSSSSSSSPSSTTRKQHKQDWEHLKRTAFARAPRGSKWTVWISNELKEKFASYKIEYCPEGATHGEFVQLLIDVRSYLSSAVSARLSVSPSDNKSTTAVRGGANGGKTTGKGSPKRSAMQHSTPKITTATPTITIDVAPRTSKTRRSSVANSWAPSTFSLKSTSSSTAVSHPKKPSLHPSFTNTSSVPTPTTTTNSWAQSLRSSLSLRRRVGPMLTPPVPPPKDDVPVEESESMDESSITEEEEDEEESYMDSSYLSESEEEENDSDDDDERDDVTVFDDQEDDSTSSQFASSSLPVEMFRGISLLSPSLPPPFHAPQHDQQPTPSFSNQQQQQIPAPSYTPFQPPPPHHHPQDPVFKASKDPFLFYTDPLFEGDELPMYEDLRSQSAGIGSDLLMENLFFSKMGDLKEKEEEDMMQFFEYEKMAEKEMMMMMMEGEEEWFAEEKKVLAGEKGMRKGGEELPPYLVEGMFGVVPTGNTMFGNNGGNMFPNVAPSSNNVNMFAPNPISALKPKPHAEAPLASTPPSQKPTHSHHQPLFPCASSSFQPSSSSSASSSSSSSSANPIWPDPQNQELDFHLLLSTFANTGGDDAFASSQPLQQMPTPFQPPPYIKSNPVFGVGGGGAVDEGVGMDVD